MADKVKIACRELEKKILEKIDTIKDKTLTLNVPNDLLKFEVLVMVSDELSDVLLNFEPRMLENEPED